MSKYVCRYVLLFCLLALLSYGIHSPESGLAFTYRTKQDTISLSPLSPTLSMFFKGPFADCSC
jgi:hypothetical protein